MKQYWDLWHGKTWYQPSFFRDVCSEGRAPVGNGGFSLRSRKWMIRAIQTCPSPYTTHTSDTCTLPHDIDYPEDLYFATVLNGINAPMPNAIEASLFGVEMIFLETAMKYYPMHNHMLQDIMRLRWSKEYEHDSKKGAVTAPIGLHKPWWYHDASFLLSDEMKRQCPFMEFIIPSTLRNAD